MKNVNDNNLIYRKNNLNYEDTVVGKEPIFSSTLEVPVLALRKLKTKTKNNLDIKNVAFSFNNTENCEKTLNSQNFISNSMMHLNDISSTKAKKAGLKSGAKRDLVVHINKKNESCYHCTLNNNLRTYDLHVYEHPTSTKSLHLLSEGISCSISFNNQLSTYIYSNCNADKHSLIPYSITTNAAAAVTAKNTKQSEPENWIDNKKANVHVSYTEDFSTFNDNSSSFYKRLSFLSNFKLHDS